VLASLRRESAVSFYSLAVFDGVFSIEAASTRPFKVYDTTSRAVSCVPPRSPVTGLNPPFFTRFFSGILGPFFSSGLDIAAVVF